MYPSPICKPLFTHIKQIMKQIITLLLLLFFAISYGQENNLYPFLSNNGKYGFMDSTGRIIIKPKYLLESRYSENLCSVAIEERKDGGFRWIFIDTLGKKVFSITKGIPSDFNNGLALVNDVTSYWFINKKGENPFGKTWRNAWHYGFKDTVAYVGDDKSHTFYPINTKGERISSETLSNVELYNLSKEKYKIKKKKNGFKSDAYIAYIEEDLVGFKDSIGNVVIEPKFYSVSGFENGICAVLIKEPEYFFLNDNIFEFIIDENGNILNEIKMHHYMGLQGDLIKFYKRTNFGGGPQYIDKNGQIVLPKYR